MDPIEFLRDQIEFLDTCHVRFIVNARIMVGRRYNETAQKAKRIHSRVLQIATKYLPEETERRTVLEAIVFEPISPIDQDEWLNDGGYYDERNDPLYNAVNDQERKVRSLKSLIIQLIDDLKFKALIQPEGSKPQVSLPVSRRVFVVHGHDEEIKQAAARALERLGFEAIILHEQPDKNRTIIEKFTEYADVGFAVVLLTPDDIGRPKSDPPEKDKLRARQNVVLELGYFLGKLGRERVFVLFREDKDFEIPSDYSGVLYTPYDISGQWRFTLAKELKAAGYDVDLNTLL